MKKKKQTSFFQSLFAATFVKGKEKSKKPVLARKGNSYSKTSIQKEVIFEDRNEEQILQNSRDHLASPRTSRASVGNRRVTSHGSIQGSNQSIGNVVGIPVKRTKERYDLRYHAGMQQFQILVSQHGYNLRSRGKKKPQATLKRYSSAKEMKTRDTQTKSNKRKKRMEKRTITSNRKAKGQTKSSAETIQRSSESMVNGLKRKRPTSAFIRRSSTVLANTKPKSATRKRPQSASVRGQGSSNQSLNGSSRRRTSRHKPEERHYNLRPRGSQGRAQSKH